MKITLRLGDGVRTAEVLRRDGRIIVRLGPPAGADGIPPPVPDAAPAVALTPRALGDGRWILERDDGRRIALAGVAQGTERQLWVAGRTLRATRIVAGGGPRPADGAGLAATIPSVVLDVLVAPGDRVAEGDKLVLLESMKMVVPIVAPFDGTVVAVACAKGDAVGPGVPLVQLEADGAGAAP